MITNNATQQSKGNKQRLKKQRKQRVTEFISDNPNMNIYSISNELEIPRTSLITILNELEEDLEIKSEQVKSGDRKKKIYKVRTVKDFNLLHFTISMFRVKDEFQKLVIKLVNNSLKRNNPVTIELDDGSEQILQPGESIEELLILHL